LRKTAIFGGLSEESSIISP
jgi:hypothetical protein